MGSRASARDTSNSSASQEASWGTDSPGGQSSKLGEEGMTARVGEREHGKKVGRDRVQEAPRDAEMQRG